MVDIAKSNLSDSLSQFAGQRILITGASGFIGSHLCRHLCGGGVEVHGVSRRNVSGSESAVNWWQGDLAEASTVRGLLTSIKPDYIFHLASHNSGSRDPDLVLPTFHSNLMSTVNLLTVAREIGCRRIVLTGSMEEPDAANPEPIPCSPYAAAKWASSAYARMFHALYELPVVILRVFMVYGFGEHLHKLIPSVILSLHKREAPKVTSGQRQADWIYVEDVVEALLAAAKAENIEGETIDVGSGKLVPIRTVVEELVRLIDPQIEPCFGALPERPMEQIRVADTARSRAMIGWEPATSLEEGLKRTVSSYKRQVGRPA